jgi:hypothetical protein
MTLFWWHSLAPFLSKCQMTLMCTVQYSTTFATNAPKKNYQYNLWMNFQMTLNLLGCYFWLFTELWNVCRCYLFCCLYLSLYGGGMTPPEQISHSYESSPLPPANTKQGVVVSSALFLISFVPASVVTSPLIPLCFSSHPLAPPHTLSQKLWLHFHGVIPNARGFPIMEWAVSSIHVMGRILFTFHANTWNLSCLFRQCTLKLSMLWENILFRFTLLNGTLHDFWQSS